MTVAMRWRFTGGSIYGVENPVVTKDFGTIAVDTTQDEHKSLMYKRKFDMSSYYTVNIREHSSIQCSCGLFLLLVQRIKKTSSCTE